MKKVFVLLLIFISCSCGRRSSDHNSRIITVSIAPFKYFVDNISDGDFEVNVMVPPGANPHIYEPFPEQVIRLSKSSAYISNGFLGFEMTWLDRFYEMNRTMLKLSLGEKIDAIVPERRNIGDSDEGADPHYWVSLRSAVIIATSVKGLLCTLNPGEKGRYESNCTKLILKINKADSTAQSLFRDFQGKSFMIYHPNLAYLARDYGLKEIPVEFEGKEPPPSRLKELVDLARSEKLKTIFVQKEYDSKNAKVIAREIGAQVKVIDPMSEDWFGATMDIINCLHDSLIESRN